MADVQIVTLKVEKTVYVSEEKVVLTLSPEEAKTLLIILANVGGFGARKYVNGMFAELSKTTKYDYQHRISGTITFPPESEKWVEDEVKP